MQASAVRMTSPEALSVTVPLPEGIEGPLDVEITFPNGARRTLLGAVTATDTSMMRGSGLNTREGPILRPVDGGYLRKDPGTREWIFVAGQSDAQMRDRASRRQAELVRKHGDEFREIVIDVRDASDVTKLQNLNLPACEAVPCTVAVRVLYRQLVDITRVGLRYWSRGERPPTHPTDADRLNVLPETQVTKPRDSPSRAEGPAFAASPITSSRATLLPVQSYVDVFDESFESNVVPGPVWSARDLNVVGGLDYWGDVGSACGAVHTGSWSVHCARHQRETCGQYYNNQNAYLELAGPNGWDGYLLLNQYTDYEVSTWVKCTTEADFDSLYWYTSNGNDAWISTNMATGTLNWTKWTNLFSNADHRADTLRFRYQFLSDFTNTGPGVYLDDIKVRGNTLQPNLTYCGRPSCADGPLYVTRSSGSATLYVEQWAYIDGSVRNTSDVAAGPFWIDYWLDPGTPNQRLIGSRQVQSLAGNASYRDPDVSLFLTSSEPGWHTIRMTVDATGAVAEAFEADNEYEQDFYWNPVVNPNLGIYRVDANPPNPVVGQSVQIVIGVSNYGSAATSGSFYVDWYRNRSTPPGAGTVGDQSFVEASPIGIGQVKYYYVYTTQATPTTWNMWVQLDRTNAVTENDEFDNLWNGPLTWQGAPDLIVESITPSVAYPYVGQAVDIAVIVRNQGTGSTTGSFFTDLYRDLAVPPYQGQPTGDRLQTTTIVAAGARDTLHFSVTSADTLLWRMYAYVDGSQTITGEVSEANNVFGPQLLRWYPAVSISGNFVYFDSLASGNRGLPCARVVLYDRDSVVAAPDDSLAAGYTDTDGHFGPITLANYDSDAGGKLDVYARVYLHDAVGCVGGPNAIVVDSLGFRWYFATWGPPITDIGDGAQDIGTHAPLLSDYGHRAAMHLYATLARGREWIRARSDVVPQVLVRWWPYNANVTRYNPNTRTIFIHGQWDPIALFPDEYDDDVILHEYGHHVESVFFFTYAPYAPPTHSWGSQDTSIYGAPYPELSFSEGWASYFACEVSGNAVFTNRGDEENHSFPLSIAVDLEACTLTSTGGTTVDMNENGPSWSIAVAGALWDVADAPNDDRGSHACADSLFDGVQPSWQAVSDGLAYNFPKDACGFVPFLKEVGGWNSQRASRIDQAFCEHGIWCQPPVSVGSPGAGFRPGTLLCAPNPFQAGTTFAFDVGQAITGVPVRLKVYDVSGHAVRTLVNERLEAGPRQIAWDGKSNAGARLPVGVYFAQLVIGGRREVARLVLVR